MKRSVARVLLLALPLLLPCFVPVGCSSDSDSGSGTELDAGGEAGTAGTAGTAGWNGLGGSGGAPPGDANVLDALTLGATLPSIAKFVRTNAQPSQYYGSSVAISGDTGLVASHTQQAVLLLQKLAGVWSLDGLLGTPDAPDGIESVAIDGDTAVICKLGYLHIGGAYVFERTAGKWEPTAQLHASDATEDDMFGNSVSISNDTIVVGARQNLNGLPGAA